MSTTNGEILERVVKLETEYAHVKETLDEVHDDVKEMRSVLDQAKGGWKAYVALGSIAAILGGLLVKVATWAGMLPK